MRLELTPEQEERQVAFHTFAERAIRPFAQAHDHDQHLPRERIRELAREGYLGAMIATKHGGAGLDRITIGLLAEELGRACTSTRNLLTVHGMVALALARMGTNEQRRRWLPELAMGEVIGAFALTEPDVGSDAKSLHTVARKTDDGFVLEGRKRWITMGQIADLILVFARCEDQPTAFLLEGDTPGLTRHPIEGLLGHRGSMLAELHLEGCRIPAESMLGHIGTGLSMVGLDCLDYGRYTIAWGCVGLIRACLEDSVAYARDRAQFGRPIGEHQLVQQMITRMAVDLEAARLLCLRSGYLYDCHSPESIMATWNAKYFASRAAVRAAADAVQIHGANGCLGGEHRVERLYRDAKIHEIIEGSTQVHEMLIARHVVSTLDTGA